MSTCRTLKYFVRTALGIGLVYGGVKILSFKNSTFSFAGYNKSRKSVDFPPHLPISVHAKCEDYENDFDSETDFVECNVHQHYYDQFIRFASYEFHGQRFMSPKDFVASIAYYSFGNPIPTSCYRLDEVACQKILSNTPRLRRLTKRSFRDLGNQGLISFYDYVFLIHLLQKPKRGFALAFKVFDRDNNNTIDLKEYNKINKLLMDMSANTSNNSSGSGSEPTPQNGEKTKINETTLTRLFFGKNGDSKLSLDDLSTFAETIQTEVLDIEFTEFSKGMKSITPTDLGELLLRRCRTSPKKHAFYLNRLQKRMPQHENISFEAFYDAVKLFQDLDDFQFAIQLFVISGRSVSSEEFQRAVRSVKGKPLDPNVIKVFFALFDNDGDGMLNYNEFFLSFRPSPLPKIGLTHPSSRFSAFKSCVKRELK